jgi:hypothetical protein
LALHLDAGTHLTLVIRTLLTCGLRLAGRPREAPLGPLATTLPAPGDAVPPGPVAAAGRGAASGHSSAATSAAARGVDRLCARVPANIIPSRR